MKTIEEKIRLNIMKKCDKAIYDITYDDSCFEAALVSLWKPVDTVIWNNLFDLVADALEDRYEEDGYDEFAL
jgi:hypothetical protein